LSAMRSGSFAFWRSDSMRRRHGCGKAARRTRPHQPFLFMRFAKPA
jgi:hypothetical protein